MAERGEGIHIRPEHDVALRQPAISLERSQELAPKITKQWMAVTGVILSEMKIDPQVRRIMCDFAARELNENLPVQFLRSLMTVNENIRVALEQNLQLWQYLEAPPVPESHVTPHIGRTLVVPSLDERKEQAEIFKTSQKEFDADISSGNLNTRGLYSQVMSLVVARQGFARDIKYFALGAEILEAGFGDSQGDIHLESGTHVYINPDQEKTADLINPLEWKKRKQIRHRMYEVTVRDRTFILKEKKTKYHPNIGTFRVEDSNLAKDEYEIAQLFQENGRMSEGCIFVNWEKSIGYVEFPDGYQFTIFEKLEDLWSESAVQIHLPEFILQHQKQFEEEYKQLQARLGISISFEKYATLKARRLCIRADRLLKETELKLGYRNQDSSANYLYRIYSGEELKLEVVGFDFEHCKKVENAEAELERIKGIHDRFDDERYRGWFQPGDPDVKIFHEMIKMEREQRTF